MFLNEHLILTCANNLTEMSSLLERGGYDALFCDKSIGIDAWKETLEET